MEDILFKQFIDPEQWDSAGWKGIAFLHDPAGVEPPCIGIVFDDIGAGKQIFSAWLHRLGAFDRHEDLRISIIEGEILGASEGYSAHISLNPERAVYQVQSPGGKETTIIVSRSYRLTPAPGSPNLPRFKEQFARHKRYLLLPVSSELKPEFSLAIWKSEIHFRQTSEITARDFDACVFPEHYFDHDGKSTRRHGKSELRAPRLEYNRSNHAGSPNVRLIRQRATS